MFEKRAAKSFIQRAARPKSQEEAPAVVPAPRRRQQIDLSLADQMRARAAALKARIESLEQELADVERALKAYEGPPKKPRRRAEQMANRLSDNAASYMFSEQMDLTVREKRKKNLAISEAMSARSDVLLRAARTKGYSLRGLAKEMGVLPASLHAYKSGTTPIPRRHAEWIEKHIGLPASSALWPAGIADE